MKEGLPGGKLRLSPKSELEEARLHVARWIRSQSQGALTSACSPSTESWSRSSPRRLTPTGCAVLCATSSGMAPVRAVIESMTGARFVHDTLEQLGWEVLIADAQPYAQERSA